MARTARERTAYEACRTDDGVSGIELRCGESLGLLRI